MYNRDCVFGNFLEHGGTLLYTVYPDSYDFVLTVIIYLHMVLFGEKGESDIMVMCLWDSFGAVRNTFLAPRAVFGAL